MIETKYMKLPAKISTMKVIFIIPFGFKFMLGCRFSFEAYVKKGREKATKFSFKPTEVLLDADAHVLT